MAVMTELAAAAKKAAIAERTASGAKPCARCHEVLSLACYGSNSSAPDGHDAYCRGCRSQWQRERYQRRKAAVLTAGAEATRQAQQAAEAARLAQEEAGRLDWEVNRTAELRCAAYVVAYRLGCGPVTALRIAVQIEPQRSRGHRPLDRVEVAVWMSRADLEQLAASAGSGIHTLSPLAAV